MIVDVHAHLGDDPVYERRQSAEDLLARMDRAGVDRAVISPMARPGDIEEQRRLIAEAVQRYPDRLVGLLLVNPWLDQSTVEADLSRYGCKGVVVDVEVFAANLRRPQFRELFERAAGAGVPIVLNSDHPLSRISLRLAEQLHHIMARCPVTRVVARASIPALGLVARDQQNIYLDLHDEAGHLGVARTVRAYGAQRVMFGSDAPTNHPYSRRAVVEAAPLSPEQRAQVLGGTARALFAL